MSQPANEMRYGGRYHLDDRGQRYCDIFPEIGAGDINVSVIEPGSAALWHRHRRQADYQFVIKGSLKIGMCNLPNLAYNPQDLSDNQVVYIDKEHKSAVDSWCEIYNNSEELKSTWSLDEPQIQWHYLSERNACQGPLYIPTGLWHGCYNYTNEPAILIYHITSKYDGTDEERLDPFVAQWNYERINK